MLFEGRLVNNLQVTFCNPLFPATSFMIHDFRAVPFHHHIELNWKVLVIIPLRYSVWYSCRYFRANTPYIQGDRNFSSKTVFVKISKLRPGSVCRVGLRAVYNPASIDRGLVEVLETNPASKFIRVACMCMQIYVVNIILGTHHVHVLVYVLVVYINFYYLMQDRQLQNILWCII